jgi:CRISPR-associated protein Cmr1
MSEDHLDVKVRTLTPIWTGGVEGNCDSLHETSIIGSMRWWYEAICSGFGYSCDPSSTGRCELSGKEKNVKERMAKLCPSCALFGCGGYSRQFNLRINDAPKTSLHFRTSIPMNKNWLKQIFGGEDKNIDSMNIFYGDITLRVLLKRKNADFSKSQFFMLLSFLSKYGAFGAKIQHGFGQFQLLNTEFALDNEIIKSGLRQLSERINDGQFLQKQDNPSSHYNLKNFICLEYDLETNSMAVFMNRRNHLGAESKVDEVRYLPCSFDLRYKAFSGGKSFGMRSWLEDMKSWDHGSVNMLMGVSNKKGEPQNDKYRSSSSLNFGMPYRVNEGSYRLRIFGFAPQDALSANELVDLSKEYMHYAFGKSCNPRSVISGREILESMGGCK